MNKINLVSMVIIISCSGCGSDQPPADLTSAKSKDQPQKKVEEVKAAIVDNTVTFSFKDATLAEVIDTMRRQTDYDFRLGRDALESAVPITLNVFKIHSDAALDLIIQREKKLVFRVFGKMVFISGPSSIIKIKVGPKTKTRRGTFKDTIEIKK